MRFIVVKSDISSVITKIYLSLHIPKKVIYKNKYNDYVGDAD